MKKILVCLTLTICTSVIFENAGAQIRLNVNVNIGSQPAWGPTGYDYVEYYYLPDIECYYYVPNQQYIYLSGSNWVFSYSLPPRYRSYDIYTGYKVVVNEPKAYLHFQSDRIKYRGYRGNRSQVIIRNSDEPKYYVVKGHPKYNGHDNGLHKGQVKHGRH